jgi:retron-type reverse transcriptase
MKRLSRIWPDVIRFENLHSAYRKARKGKQSKPGVAEFTLNLESELLSLQQDLIDFSYQPGTYRLFTIYERKKRQIAAAPFRDRVVHHALMNVIEPAIDRRFIFDSYACRQGKGVHAAVNRYQLWSKKYPYVLKMDIQQYFPSIDHLILKEKLRHYLKDKFVLDLFDRIIDTAP